MINFKEVFSRSFEKSAVGMAILDQNGILLTCNPALCGILDRGIHDILFKGIPEFISPQEGERWVKFFTDFSRQRANDYYFESTFYPKLTREAWWSIQLSDLEYSEDGQQLFFAILQDISLKKIAEDNLREARARAEKATRTKSEFLANMSHEIRTPIHTITGLSELLVDTLLNPEQGDYVRQIGQSADVLISLVDDVLDFSKIEAGQMILDHTNFNFQHVITQALELVSPKAQAKGLEVLLTMLGDVPYMIKGDPGRLRQVLVNLLSNAVKFTQKGEVELIVQSLWEDDRLTSIRVEVRDTGIGLRQETKETLFQPFTQADSSTTRRFGGTGLGLAISRQLVEMMEGQIQADGAPGQGSVFSFTFKAEKQGTGRQTHYWDSFDFNGLRVLLVDDHAKAQKNLHRELAHLGFDVETCSSGHEAIHLLRRMSRRGESPDLVILDQDMQGMDGWQVGEAIDQDSSLKGLRMALMTRIRSTVESSRKKLNNWFQGYLTKPVIPWGLPIFLNKALKESLNKPKTKAVAPNTNHSPIPEDMLGKKVLVVEDNEVNQELFVLLLNKLGLEVLRAYNGLEAVDVFDDEEPILVFMDLQMPEMNGFEATEAIRGLGHSMPIVAVTANALKGEMEKCLQVGMNDFITKPFKRHDLIAVINRVWSRDTEEESPLAEVTRDQEEEVPDFTGELLFDYEESLNTFLGNRELVGKLARSFIDKVEKHGLEIEKALEAEDHEKAFQQAHAVKGSSLNLGALRLGKIATYLEAEGRKNHIEACEKVLPTFQEDPYGPP
jgi:two-component system sensor histidine kinase/response regulator